MRPLRFLPFAIACFVTLNGLAQKNAPKIKFGDVKPEDFAPTVYSIDSSASAVVLADIGESKFVGNNSGDFSINFNHIKRIRIMNKNGFDDATIKIYLYTGSNFSDEEKLEGLEAVTYNIENGKVVATKLDKASIFKDKYGTNVTSRKFTFPNIKEGSIIEYRYTIQTPYYTHLRPWDFQGSIPRLWSEYQVTVPTDIFEYVLLKTGYLPYVLDTSVMSRESYVILDPGDAETASRTGTLTSNTVTVHWAMKDVPGIKDESYVTTTDNYKAGVEFQLKRIKFPTHSVDYMGDWNQLVEKLMKDEDFGVPISQNNGWLNDDLKKITAGAASDVEKAEKWYNYVRDNFTCNEEGKYTTKSLKKTWQDKTGNVADVNLLLLAGIKNLGFDACPAILSTRDNGKANEMYPLLNQYNYVICSAQIGGRHYSLDATNKMVGFGKLPEELYNGSARQITNVPELITLSADSIRESKLTTVFMTNDDGGKGLSGTFTTKLGEFEGLDFRKKLTKQSQDDYFKEVKKGFSFETNITETEIDSLKTPDEPVTVKYSFTVPMGDDMIYFNPLLGEAYKSNPFKSAERLYPVEMPSCSDETYLLNMEVPKGYKVEELPKSMRVKLNEDDGMFEYIVAQDNNKIQLRCRVVLKKANFLPEDYQTLRDFFGRIVEKQAEQIVFKKI